MLSCAFHFSKVNLFVFHVHSHRHGGSLHVDRLWHGSLSKPFSATSFPFFFPHWKSNFVLDTVSYGDALSEPAFCWQRKHASPMGSGRRAAFWNNCSMRLQFDWEWKWSTHAAHTQGHIRMFSFRRPLFGVWLGEDRRSPKKAFIM